MKIKYHGMMATLQRETDDAVMVDATHPEYGSIRSFWLPKSVIHEDSLDEIEESADGDELEIFVKAWFLRKSLGDVSNF